MTLTQTRKPWHNFTDRFIKKSHHNIKGEDCNGNLKELFSGGYFCEFCGATFTKDRIQTGNEVVER